jgi:hypothetical protein
LVAFDTKQTWRGYRERSYGSRENESANGVESTSIKAHSTDETGALFDHSDALEQTGHGLKRRRRLLMGAAAASILAFAVVLGIPWIRETLNTVSTDDAYVNGHGGPRAWSGVQGSGG